MTSRAELEALIDASPTEDAPYLILADWLQLHGDPRGELIALDAAAARERTATRVWQERRRDLISRHPELEPPGPSELRLAWHLGFVRRVGIDHQEPWLEELAHPAFRFVTEVMLYEPDHDELADRIRELARRFPLLRSISIGDPDDRWYRRRDSTQPLALPELVPQLAQLEHVYSVEPIVLDGAHGLRRLSLHATTDDLRRLASTSLPALGELGIRPASMREPSVVSVDQLRWLLASPPPQLAALELEGFVGDELIAALAGAPLLRQLRRLRLWNAGLTPEGAQSITRETFGHLELLDLSDPLLSAETIALVDGVCPDVRTISPWMREILRRPG